MEDINYTGLDRRWAIVPGVALSRLHQSKHFVFGRNPG